MNFGDTFNYINLFNMADAIYKVVEQDPMSFMVVYPMTLMTSSMLIFALIQDLIPVYKTKFAHVTINRSRRAPAAAAFKRNQKAGNRIQLTNRFSN